MKILAILAAAYVIGMPILFRLIAFLHKKLITDRKIEKLGKTKAAQKDLPTPIWGTWKERLSFTMKDKRDFMLKKKKKNDQQESSKLQNRQIFFGIWGLGLLLVIIGYFTNMWQLTLSGFITFFIAMGFGIHIAKDILEARKNIYARMFEIAESKLGQSMEYKNNPEQIIRVLEWNDYIKPNKVEFDIPTKFSDTGQEGFLKQFNQIFGQDTAWVPSDNPETGKSGWDYEQGKVTLHAVPPLPQMAPWSERYVLDENIAWSFFPIALGVENGVELTNPETGQIENVLGFDVSGEQIKMAKKTGVKVSPKITTSPMCLTGDTLVLTEKGCLPIEEISRLETPILVKSVNSNFEFVWNKMIGTQLTRKNTEIVRLTFDDGSTVKCTPDHRWLLSYGTYVEAKDLLNLYIRGYGQEKLKVVRIEEAGYADVYDGEVEHTHNFVVILDENTMKGALTSNCFVGGGTGGGKSLAVNTLVQVLEEQ